MTSANSLAATEFVEDVADDRWPARILYVDDNDRDVALAMRAFRQATCRAQITRAHDGQEALDILAASGPGELPHLIVLDLTMPVMDGREFLDALEATPWKRVPVIVLTGSTSESDICSCHRHGVAGYVGKPDTPEQYCETVQLILGIWLVISHLSR